MLKMQNFEESAFNQVYSSISQYLELLQQQCKNE